MKIFFSFRSLYIVTPSSDKLFRYGGVNPDVDNVVFVHGTIDPWHAMGVLQDISAESPAIYINGTSHCNDMYGDRSTDSEALTEARLRIGELVAQWVQPQP